MRIITAALLAAMATALAAPAPALALSAQASLASRIDPLVEAFPGGSAILVADPSSAVPMYERDGDREIIAASLYKLGILAAVEMEVERGGLRYGDVIVIEDADITADGSFVIPGAALTVDDALELMITLSDNGTAMHFWRMLGGAYMNEVLGSFGVAGLHIAVDESDENVVTPRAIGSYFSLLAKGELVSRAASERMLLRLERQQINDRIPAHLPAGTLVAHKTGDLPGLVHDAGLVFTTHGPRVVVAMTWDVDELTADELIAEVASQVYGYTVAPPFAAGYRIPQGPRFAEIGRPMTLAVQVRNEGLVPWTASGEGRVGFVWEVRDTGGLLLERSARPIALGDVQPGRAAARRIAVPMPRVASDLTLTIELVDAAGQRISLVRPASIAIMARPAIVEHSPGPAFSR